MIRCIVVLIEILFCYLLQSSVFTFFELAGVVPDVLLILVVSTAFFCGQRAGLLTGFISGLLMDFCIGDVIGLFAAFYMLIGFLNGYSAKVYDKDDYFMPLGMVAVSELLYSILYYVFFLLLRGNLHPGYYFIHTAIPRTLYTIFAAILFYKLFQTVHSLLCRIENREKKQC